MKVECIKLPLAPPQVIPPPLYLTVLFMKLQFFNMPLLPYHCIAPPFPLVKLKFMKYKYLLSEKSSSIKNDFEKILILDAEFYSCAISQNY